MPVFNDAIDLRFAVTDMLGNRNISDVMPRLIQMAESKINRTLRVNQQIVSETLTFVNGMVDLPDDFLEMIDVLGPCGFQMRSGSTSSYAKPWTMYSQYSIVGGSLRISGYSGDNDINYYGALPSLSLSPSMTNWLLMDYPDVYLYAVAFEAAKFLKDVELTGQTKTLLDDAIMSVRIDDERTRWANGSVRVAGITP